ncbi:unnamed protein product, partial [Didymodactylos carnosus]
MRGSKHRSIADALLMFWVKLKTNLTYNQIGILFNYDTSSEDRRKRVSDSCDAVMDCLLKHFVPNFLGLNRVTYQQALAHDTIYSKTFFGNGFKFTWDATYFFVNKSSDHVLQKKTYSGQKKRHYVKMMSVTLSDGYVLDTSGPYPGSKNDAQIAEHITKVNEHLAKCCGNDAVAIVDRGFDRVRTVFEDLDFLCDGNDYYIMPFRNGTGFTFCSGNYGYNLPCQNGSRYDPLIGCAGANTAACSSNPCLNGGRCIQIENEYKCLCPAYFEGEH